MISALANDDQVIRVYTDGSCLGNPGIGGWAALIRYSDKQEWLRGNAEMTTNNRMELQAVIASLRHVHEHACLPAWSREHGLIIYTDSQYVQKGIQEWSHVWQKRNWRTAAGKAVKNQDLWRQLIDLRNETTPEWCWIKGHNGHEWNEQVDSAARDAATSVKPSITR